MSGAARIHSVCTKELIHELVHRFWFGKRRGSVIEVEVLFHSVSLLLCGLPVKLVFVSVCLARTFLFFSLSLAETLNLGEGEIWFSSVNIGLKYFRSENVDKILLL